MSQAAVKAASTAACSVASSSAAAAAALTPVRWTYVPHLVPYNLGLALQEHLVARRANARTYLSTLPSSSPSHTPSAREEAAQRISATDTLLLLQHSPVYTEGRRKGAQVAVGDDKDKIRLEALGADYVVAQRGGLITYHGPGQLTGYPIIDLAAMNLSTRCYVDYMQTSLASVLHGSPFNLSTVAPPDDHTGVWSDVSHKIASIGIQVRHRITSHGFALNVEAQTLLPWFRHIVACGIEGKGMTAVERELALRIKAEEDVRPDREAAREGETRLDEALTRDPSLEIEPGLMLGPEARCSVPDIVPHVVRQFGATYKREMRLATEEELRYEADATGRLSKVWVEGEQVVVPS